MKDPAWKVVEKLYTLYTQDRFVKQSIKRDSEFETLWQAAYDEGGKQVLQDFFANMEWHAKSV